MRHFIPYKRTNYILFTYSIVLLVCLRANKVLNKPAIRAYISSLVLFVHTIHALVYNCAHKNPQSQIKALIGAISCTIEVNMA